MDVVHPKAVADANANHFGRLPPELVRTICSYLLISHEPHRSSLDTEPPSPLTQLALVSHACRDAVESYARGLLLQWAPVTESTVDRMLKSKKTKTHRGILLQWKEVHCVWCGKESERKAILATGLGCCWDCDKEEWPDKIVYFPFLFSPFLSPPPPFPTF